MRVGKEEENGNHLLGYQQHFHYDNNKHDHEYELIYQSLDLPESCMAITSVIPVSLTRGGLVEVGLTMYEPVVVLESAPMTTPPSN